MSQEILRQKIHDCNTVIKEQGFKDGSTMAFTAIKEKKVYSAHLGDSRIIIVNKNGEISFQTHDHKPENRDEVERIREAGSFIMKKRVANILAVSRCLGDYNVNGVGHDPEIQTYDIKEDDKWLIICCDGVYDVMSSQHVANIAKDAKSAIELAYDIRNEAYSLLAFIKSFEYLNFTPKKLPKILY